VFTFQLADVASRQTEILNRIDAALHLAATAQSASAQTAEELRLFTEATNRAWIGPVSARSEPFEVGKPVKITMLLNNTGRLPAIFKSSIGGTFFTKDYWEDGRAKGNIDFSKSPCMNGLPGLEEPLISRGVAYPTTGVSLYSVTYNSSTIQTNRFVLAQQDLDPSRIFTIVGCVVYRDIYERSEGKDHHSFFCFYRDDESAGDVNQLVYCPAEQAED
jgi:hypothetical protein